MQGQGNLPKGPGTPWTLTVCICGHRGLAWGHPCRELFFFPLEWKNMHNIKFTIFKKWLVP